MTESCACSWDQVHCPHCGRNIRAFAGDGYSHRQRCHDAAIGKAWPVLLGDQETETG